MATPAAMSEAVETDVLAAPPGPELKHPRFVICQWAGGLTVSCTIRASAAVPLRLVKIGGNVKLADDRVGLTVVGDKQIPPPTHVPKVVPVKLGSTELLGVKLNVTDGA